LPPTLNEGRLDSWKKIAVYLKRDITTVQRWEKREGMPVHRHLHDKMGSVYAFQPELDAWMRARSEQPSPSASDQPPIDGATPGPARASTFRARWPFLAITATLAVT